jgi:hypothetical protein
MGVIKIIENIKPKQELKKLSFVWAELKNNLLMKLIV